MLFYLFCNFVRKIQHFLSSMANNFRNFWRLRQEMNDMYSDSRDKGLKIALGLALGIIVVLSVVILVWLNDLSDCTFMILRGLTGFGAVVAVVVAGVLSYRVSCRHIQSRGRRGE